MPRRADALSQVLRQSSLSPTHFRALSDFVSASDTRSLRQDEIERGNHRWMNKKYPPPGSSSGYQSLAAGGGGGGGGGGGVDGQLDADASLGGGSGSSSTVCLTTVQTTPVGSAVYFSGDSMDADQRQQVGRGLCDGVCGRVQTE